MICPGHTHTHTHTYTHTHTHTHTPKVILIVSQNARLINHVLLYMPWICNKGVLLVGVVVFIFMVWVSTPSIEMTRAYHAAWPCEADIYKVWTKYVGSVHWTQNVCPLNPWKKCLPSIHENKMSALYAWYYHGSRTDLIFYLINHVSLVIENYLKMFLMPWSITI